MIVIKSLIETVTNTECVVLLINKTYFREILSEIKFIKMTTSINVKRLRNAFHEINNYALLNVFLNDTSKKKSARGHIHKKFHLIKDLKCKVLLSVDIFAAEQVTFNTANKIMVIFTCKNLIVLIKIASKSNARIKRVIYFKDQTLILSKSIIKVLIYLKEKRLSDNKDYLFESNQEQFTSALKNVDGFYAHVCDAYMICV